MLKLKNCNVIGPADNDISIWIEGIVLTIPNTSYTGVPQSEYKPCDHYKPMRGGVTKICQ